MKRTINSLGDLGSLLNDASNADDDILMVLADSSAAKSAVQKAMNLLKSSVKFTLSMLDGDSGLNFNTGSDYVDFCRNLAAYLLVSTPEDELYGKSFLSLNELLQLVTPDSKKELRALLHAFKEERAHITELGFGWDDLKKPFEVNAFTAAFVKTKIVKEAVPEVIVVEKEVEKIVEKEVERIVVQKQEVIVEVEKEDVNDFGPEGHLVEHKQTFFCESYNEKPMPYNVCREICAFLNADGGKVYIGVADNGMALPKFQGKFPAGVNMDVQYMTRSERLPFGKNTTDAYCIAIKQEIEKRFAAENDIEKFINEIHVEETKNENVVVIEVPKSRYCVVRLEGVVFQRSGSECKALSQPQIELRNQELLSVTKEAHFRSLLQRAIDDEKQVVLYGYESTNSGTIENRYVEPVNFVCENTSIICYDLKKEATRQFKLSRIGDVKVLDAGWEHKDRHEVTSVDIFGWTDRGKKFDICLDLLLPAKNDLIEHHPNATKNSFEKVGDGYWRLEATVFSLEPVRNFFICHADSMEIRQTKDSDLLKQMILDYVQEFISAKISHQ